MPFRRSVSQAGRQAGRPTARFCLFVHPPLRVRAPSSVCFPGNERTVFCARRGRGNTVSNADGGSAVSAAAPSVISRQPRGSGTVFRMGTQCEQRASDSSWSLRCAVAWGAVVAAAAASRPNACRTFHGHHRSQTDKIHIRLKLRFSNSLRPLHA